MTAVRPPAGPPLDRRRIEAAVVGRDVAARRRSVLGCGVGLGGMIVWVMALYPSVEGELAAYVESMPAAMQALFGLDDVSSLAGFVHAEIFSLMGPLVFCGLAIANGSAAIAGEERDRALPLVLATGVGRGRLVWSKAVALTVQLAGLGALTFAALLVGSRFAGGGLGVAGAAAATLQLTALGVLFAALALALGAATGNRSLAAGAAAGGAVVAYLVDGLANVVEWLEPAASISPFDWYAPQNPLVEGLSLGGLAALAAVTVALVVAGTAVFDRRDIHL